MDSTGVGAYYIKDLVRSNHQINWNDTSCPTPCKIGSGDLCKSKGGKPPHKCTNKYPDPKDKSFCCTPLEKPTGTISTTLPKQVFNINGETNIIGYQLIYYDLGTKIPSS